MHCIQYTAFISHVYLSVPLDVGLVVLAKDEAETLYDRICSIWTKCDHEYQRCNKALGVTELSMEMF
jgi:hypothetical protein